MKMKTVIYKENGFYYTTPEANYNARIRDASAINKAWAFNSAEEIIYYFCKYCGSKPEDFIIINA